MNKKTEIVRLKELVEKKARQYGEFTLSSGLKAAHYFDLKMVLCDPEGAYLVGECIFDSLVRRIFKLIIRKRVEAIGGYGLGASSIVTAVVLISGLKGHHIRGFEVIEREKLREDDPQGSEDNRYVIKGHLPPAGGKVAVVDDVVSTGRAIFMATEAVENKGCQVVVIRTVLDRQLGGSEELRRRGYDFTALLRADPSGKVYIN